MLDRKVTDIYDDDDIPQIDLPHPNPNDAEYIFPEFPHRENEPPKADI